MPGSTENNPSAPVGDGNINYYNEYLRGAQEERQQKGRTVRENHNNLRKIFGAESNYDNLFFDRPQREAELLYEKLYGKLIENHGDEVGEEDKKQAKLIASKKSMLEVARELANGSREGLDYLLEILQNKRDALELRMLRKQLELLNTSKAETGRAADAKKDGIISRIQMLEAKGVEASEDATQRMGTLEAELVDPSTTVERRMQIVSEMSELKNKHKEIDDSKELDDKLASIDTRLGELRQNLNDRLASTSLESRDVLISMHGQISELEQTRNEIQAEVIKAKEADIEAMRAEVESTDDKIKKLNKTFPASEYTQSRQDSVSSSSQVPEGNKDIIKESKEKRIEAVRQFRELDDEMQANISERQELKKDNTDENTRRNERKEKLADSIEDLERKIVELEESSPEAFYALKLMEIRSYKDQLESRGVVETPYVKRIISEALAKLQEADKSVLLQGHLGTGKTELAKHIAREYIGKEPILFPSSVDTQASDIVGRQVLRTDEESGSTVSSYELGPVYQAMLQGRPLIIDEFNFIPSGIRVTLYDYMGKKKGDKVTSALDGAPIEVAEGFCIIFTGNIGNQYRGGRQEMDAAFESRIHPIEYEYLPQEIDGSLGQFQENMQQWRESDSKGSPPRGELFTVILSKLVDRQGRLTIPEGSLEKIWEFSKASKIIQNFFIGKGGDVAKLADDEGNSVNYNDLIKQKSLSLRAVVDIIGDWKRDGYRYELDYYIYTDFIKGTIDPEEKEAIYTQFRLNGFFESPGWPEPRDVVDFDVMAIPKNKQSDSTSMEFYFTEDIIEKLNGPAPEGTYKFLSEADIEEELNNLDAEMRKLALEHKEIKSQLLEKFFGKDSGLTPEEALEILEKDCGALDSDVAEWLIRNGQVELLMDKIDRFEPLDSSLFDLIGDNSVAVDSTVLRTKKQKSALAGKIVSWLEANKAKFIDSNEQAGAEQVA